MKKIVFAISATFCVLVTMAQNEFKAAANNMEYKLVPATPSSNIALKNGDKAAFSVVQKMNDSLVFNSYEAGHQIIQIDTTSLPLDIRVVLKEMLVGDSALIRLEANKILLEEKLKAQQQDPNFNEEAFNQNVPAFFKTPGNYIYIGLRLLDKFATDTANASFAADAKREAAYSQQQTATQNAYQAKLQKEQEAKSKLIRASGEKFLASNKTKPGVITTKTGLQYKVIKQGKGIKPTKQDKAQCHYAGTLLNGFEFDNSYKRGAPYEFDVTGNVIDGWKEVVLLMNEGTKLKVWIPSTLGYGDYGNGPSIGPGEVLVFDMELVKVIKGKKAVTTPKPGVAKPAIKKPVAKPVKKAKK